MVNKKKEGREWILMVGREVGRDRSHTHLRFWHRSAGQEHITMDRISFKYRRTLFLSYKFHEHPTNLTTVIKPGTIQVG